MSPKRANTAATAPATTPRSRRETLTVISALASAISSRTRSCTFSVTSWIASPRSEGRGSVIARDRPEDLREQEGAHERGARQHLGPVGGGPRAAGLGGGPRRGPGGGRLRARRGRRADPGRAHRRAGDLARRASRLGRALRGILREALGLVGLLAGALRLGGGLLGLLAGLALLARQPLLLLLGRCALLLQPADLALGGHLVDLRDARLALGARGLGRRLAIGRGGLRLLGGGHRAALGGLPTRRRLARRDSRRAIGVVRALALVVLVGHSGGSSPNARTQIRWASLELAIVASEPRAASSPDHMRRLTISLSVMVAGVKQTVPTRAPRGRRRWSRRRTAWPARSRPRPAPAARRSSP